MKTISLKHLQQIGAGFHRCNLFKEFNLENFPIEQVPYIIGDYDGLIHDAMTAFPFATFNNDGNVVSIDMDNMKMSIQYQNNLRSECKVTYYYAGGRHYTDVYNFFYDDNARLIKIKKVTKQGSYNYTRDYSYNDNGTLNEIIYNDELRTAFKYDLNNRLISVVTINLLFPQGLITPEIFEYDSNGNLIKSSNGNWMFLNNYDDNNLRISTASIFKSAGTQLTSVEFFEYYENKQLKSISRNGNYLLQLPLIQ